MKTDLEPKRGIFFQAGMVLSLAAVLAAFEWRTEGPGGVTLNLDRSTVIEEDLADITIQKKPKPQMPEPVVIKKIVVEMNDAKFEDEPLEINAEVDETTANNPDFSLDHGTTYYWQIITWDSHGASTVGPIWSFTTKNLDLLFS